MENVLEILEQHAREVLLNLEVQEITPRHVAESVLLQNTYWEKPLANNEKIMFVRLFSPVIQREEVFLGNILLNAFLMKTFARSIVQNNSGKAELVANDLENYYFLVRTSSDINQMSDAFRKEIEQSLPDLFFGEQNEDKGIYGDVETMLEFEKANVEPFPLFIVPSCHAKQLEMVVRNSLKNKIEKSTLERNPTSIMANLAFFYSHDGTEMQSPYLFLGRLALKYGIIDLDDLRMAFNLSKEVILTEEADVKKIIENSLKLKESGTFSKNDLRKLLQKVIEKLGQNVEEHPEEWRMPYIRDKFLSDDQQIFIDELLHNVLIGYKEAKKSSKMINSGCRACGSNPIAIEDKSILMGQSVHKFHNQSGKYKNAEQPKICLRCAACSYLMVKLLGSEAVGQPQIPQSYNLIFHYGKHDNDSINQIVHQIDMLYDLIYQHKEAAEVRRQAYELVKKLQEKWEHEKNAQKKHELQIELDQKKAEHQQAETAITAVEDGVFSVCPFFKLEDTPAAPPQNCTLDIVSNLQSTETKTERYILGLGMGSCRMILFVLPQIRPPKDGPHDFAQRRFSNSRITVLTVLSFLRQLCGCDGPFYYQSLPTLTADTFQRSTFYVHGKPIHLDEVQKEYHAVNLAWKIIYKRGIDGLVKKIVLAEKLRESPLETFASMIRDLGLPGKPQRVKEYKPLKVPYNNEWKAYDLTEYGRFMNQLSNIEEEKLMALKVDCKKLDEFCLQLFRLLENLGKLSLNLAAKPNELEKYPRLLFGSIQRYRDVEAGFKEWASRLLRDAEYSKESCYPDLEQLRQWMVANSAIFTEKASIQHLRTSLYARVFQYIYPRRVLANVYCEKHRGNLEALKKEFIEKSFPQTIEESVEKIKQTYINEWNNILKDVRNSLLTRTNYYLKRLQKKDSEVSTGTPQPIPTEDEKEE